VCSTDPDQGEWEEEDAQRSWEDGGGELHRSKLEQAYATISVDPRSLLGSPGRRVSPVGSGYARERQVRDGSPGWRETPEGAGWRESP
jgi:hypothetical protein